MFEDFYELNVQAYWALVNGVLDVLLWCLGPYVDDSKSYGLGRQVLALATCRCVRLWLWARNDPRV